MFSVRFFSTIASEPERVHFAAFRIVWSSMLPQRPYLGPAVRICRVTVYCVLQALGSTEGAVFDICVFNVWVSCRRLYRSKTSGHPSGGTIFLKTS